MDTRSETLATRVDQTIQDFLAAVEASTPEQWATKCTDGEWTQGFAAFHAATALGAIAQAVKGVAGGQPFPRMTMETIEADNAVQAKEHEDCTIAETAAMIKNSAPAAAGMVRSLSDPQLDRKVQLMEGMPEVTVEAMVQMALIGHATYHLQTITGAR